MTDDSLLLAELTKDFQQTLNRHGYGFQFSLIQTIRNLRETQQSSWDFVAAEYPVMVHGQGTRIDFILRSLGVNRTFIVAECKRVDPSLSRWCFIKALPYAADRGHEYTFFDQVEVIDIQGIGLRAGAVPFYVTQEIYHIGVEVKTQQKGDGSGGSKQAIEDAATQVSRASSGFINALGGRQEFVTTRTPIIPVIFTTAELWTSDASLSEAELSSGYIDLSNKPVSATPWLLYQYVLSPNIKHSHAYQRSYESLGGGLDADYIRTIAIVNPSGIKSFLHWAASLIFR